jgi:propionate CoA-transferase
VDIGIGLPEEVARLLYESGVMKELEMLTEAGVFGGVAAPGVFFGAAVNPDKVAPSYDAFDQIYKRLDWAVLGCLEADSEGNVNVSNRGPGLMNYVGPGGFIDLITGAKNILFVSSWGARAKIDVVGDHVKLIDHGKPKFVEKVYEITFNGKEALKHNKNVYYVCHIGAFRLTERGMELMYVMPGIDPQKDIIDASPMKIVLPENGTPEVVGADVVTGQGFRFELKG